MLNVILDTCQECGCDRKYHMHINYEIRKFITNISINKDNDKQQSPINALEQRIRDLKEEQAAIVSVCSHLSQFLFENALNPVNDDILEYIDYFIREAKMKKNNGGQYDMVIAGLEQMKIDYKRELDLLNKTMQRNSATQDVLNSNGIIKQEEIFRLVGKLYRLPIYGAKIRAQVEQIKLAQSSAILNREQTVRLPREAQSSSVMAELRRIL